VFDIEFIGNEPEHLDEGEDAWVALRGRTTLGDYQEEFLASLGHWSPADYQRQWIEAARRLLGGADRTGFFTSAFQFWWVMWRDGEMVYAREQLLVEDTLIAPFDATDLYRQIGRRASVSEDGNQISEWRLRVADIEAFVTRRAGTYVPA
jgi:hypothetical protein